MLLLDFHLKLVTLWQEHLLKKEDIVKVATN